MAARIGQLQATLQAQTQTIQAQVSRINQLESQAASSQLLVERTAATNERVGKPFTFSSDEARFAAWQKKLRNYVAAALPGARVFMDWAGDQGSHPITREELEDRYGDQLRLLNQVFLFE